MGLSLIAHIQLENAFGTREDNFRSIEQCQARGRGSGHLLPEGLEIEARQHSINGLDEVMPHIGDDTTKRAVYTGKPGYHRRGKADFLDQGTRMQRAAAAKRHRHEFGRIVTAFDRNQTDGAGHLRIGDSDHRFRRRHAVEAERRAYIPVDGQSGGFRIQTVQFPADRPVGVDPAEHEIRVGDGRPVIAQSITDRPRIGARRFRPHLQ